MWAQERKQMTTCVCVAGVTSSLSGIFNITSMAGTDTEKKHVLEMVSVINIYLLYSHRNRFNALVFLLVLWEAKQKAQIISADCKE